MTKAECLTEVPYGRVLERVEVVALREHLADLRLWGKHLTGCTSKRKPHCDCGLDARLAALAARVEGA